jgi:ribosome-associated protein
MEDMSQETDKLFESALSLGNLLREHNGQAVSVLDLRGISNWTDFFIIATVSSKTHMDGLERHIKNFCLENKIEISGISPKKFGSSDIDDEWRLIDLGWAVVHLMSQKAREFYELERLWHR